MQQKHYISCDDHITEAQSICISHKRFFCEKECRKYHTDCKVLTINEFHQKFSELLKQRSEQINEVQKLQDVRKDLLNSPQKQIVQEILKLLETLNSNPDRIDLKERISLSLQEFEQQQKKEKLKEMLKYIELKNGNVVLQNDFTEQHQQLKQQLTKYMNEIKDIYKKITGIFQQQDDETESDSDSSSSECDEKQQTNENQTKQPQNIINYEPAITLLVRERDQQRDPTPTYLNEHQNIKFLLEIRDNYVIAASNYKIFLIQLQPPVVKSVYSYLNEKKEKITSISKFQNQDQFKFIIAQYNGKIGIVNSNNDILHLVKNVDITHDKYGRLLIGLSENILVTVGDNHKIKYYYPESGKFSDSKVVRGRKFIRQPPKCLLVLNDDINFIVVAGAYNLFIIRNQNELKNLGIVDQKHDVRFLGYFKIEKNDQKKELLFAATHKNIYIYDLINHNSRRYISFPHRISYFQVINNNCLVNCKVEAQVNEFRAYQIPIEEEFQKIQSQDLVNVKNRNIKLAKLQQINQNQVFQIFIVDNVAVRREGINI